MIQKSSVDKEHFVKGFEYMTHDFLIVTLRALNFGMNTLNLIFDYLTERKERVKINSGFHFSFEKFHEDQI